MISYSDIYQLIADTAFLHVVPVDAPEDPAVRFGYITSLTRSLSDVLTASGYQEQASSLRIEHDQETKSLWYFWMTDGIELRAVSDLNPASGPLVGRSDG